MKGLGLFTLVGHPLFWWVWASWVPQPYENLALRLFTASLGLLLINKKVSSDPASRLSGQVFTAVIWFELPFLFSWMYLCNGGNSAWLASVAAMILTYYFVTDWRIATIGLTVAALIAWVLFVFFGPAVPPLSPQHMLADGVVMSFCVSMGLLLGVSSANLRREHLAHTLTTMGIMAHELRTPLATMSLIGDAVRDTAADTDQAPGQKLDNFEKLATRLHMLVRNMNHQIDTQIANARLMRLPGHKEAVSAGELVREAVNNYPFRSIRERDSVQVQVRRDFMFEGSHPLFAQVIDNLMKNALRSLAAASTASQPGDLVIEVGTLHNRGRIVMTDRGIGIDPDLQPRIFEPFFSTNQGTGHGLGLAFCQRVVQSANGFIRVKSEPARGAVFTIELPILG
jgi:two-component system CAI-1 autoinducer sensor kinase/phosphatase CqsS